MMKKALRLLFVLIIVSLCFLSFIDQKDVKASGSEELIDFTINREIRAIWVSPLVSDVSRFTSESQYKSQIRSVLDRMEEYNLNVLFFHVRIYNDALYESVFNKWSSYYSTNPSWDALPWMIEECHTRGIEFHAWMNPYRVSTSSSKDAVSRNFLSINPASDPSNLLTGGTTILNPGIPAVQSFLVDVCTELITKYDIDGIHFDDYFYVSNMESDEETYYKYGTGQGIEQFRRDSIDNFIRMLHERLVRHFDETGKVVQLGVSPTAVWANGDGNVTYDEDGKAITTGSATTNAQGHYGNYLYCDTLNWINNEWIDYICPQCYIGTSNGNNNYYKEVEWWSKVVKNKPCKLVIGVGLYRAGGTDWLNNDELKTELDYNDSLTDVSGFALYSYRHIDVNNQAKRANLENAK